MKLFPVMLVTVAFSASLSISTPAYADDALVESVCNFVAADDKNRLRKKLRDAKIKLRNIYDGITCDGLNLVQFAMKKNAADVGEYVVKRLPSSKLAGGDEVKWAEENGYGASPVVAAIKARTGDSSDED